MGSLAGLSAAAELGEDVRSDIGVDGGPNAVVGGGGAEAAFVGAEPGGTGGKRARVDGGAGVQVRMESWNS
jgi:hypothetical protein